MKIIGGHDYYDHALAYGVDETIVLHRHNTEIKDHLRWGVSGFSFPTSGGGIEGYRAQPGQHYGAEFFSCAVVVGDVLRQGYAYIPGGRIKPLNPPENWDYYHDKPDPRTIQYLWHLNSFEKALKERGKTIPEYAWKGGMSGRDIKPDLYFEEKPAPEWIRDDMIKQGWSIVSYDGISKHARANTHLLREMQFASAIDPFSIYQKLEQWISGVLPNAGKPVVEIQDDKIKLAKHGMDKWSFRKMGKNSK